MSLDRIQAGDARWREHNPNPNEDLEVTAKKVVKFAAAGKDDTKNVVRMAEEALNLTEVEPTEGQE